MAAPSSGRITICAGPCGATANTRRNLCRGTFDSFLKINSFRFGHLNTKITRVTAAVRHPQQCNNYSASRQPQLYTKRESNRIQIRVASESSVSCIIMTIGSGPRSNSLRSASITVAKRLRNCSSSLRPRALQGA